MAGWGTLGATNNGPRVAHREGAANVAKVTMPQLGESVAEGTIGKWLKQPGDHVDKYEPLVEVVTDKVNAEVPSPFEGILREILAEEGVDRSQQRRDRGDRDSRRRGFGCRRAGGRRPLRPPPRRMRHRLPPRRRRSEAPVAAAAAPAAPAPAAAPAPVPRPGRLR